MERQARSKKHIVAEVVGVAVLAVLIAVWAVIRYNEKQESLYTGKRILFMGDSITYLGQGERGWCRYFCEIVNPELTVNTAVNGARWRDRENTVYDGEPVWNGADKDQNNVMGNQIEKVIRSAGAGMAEYGGFDAVFIACGTNDWAPVDIASVGDEYESGDRHTYAGAMRYAVEELHRLYPEAEIFICSPLQCCARELEDSRNLSEGFELIAEIAGVNFIDLVDCGIDREREFDNPEGDCLADGLHPNKKGAKVMGKFIADAFVKFCKNQGSDAKN